MSNIDINDMDCKYRDSDASSVIFGFKFQADAGIFLFVDFFDEIKQISIETYMQDIEIKTNDDKYILGQAKASQNPNNCKDPKQKLRNALYSLVKNDEKDAEKLIYITNIDTPLTKFSIRQFDNHIVGYDFLKSEDRQMIEGLLDAIFLDAESILKNVKSTDVQKNKARLILSKRKSFKLSKLNVLVVPQYYGEKPENYIVDNIKSFLYQKFQFDPGICNIIGKDIYDIWHKKLFNDGTIPTNKTYKRLNKDELVWPIITKSSESYNLMDIAEILPSTADRTMSDLVKERLDSFNDDYHFDLVNDINNDYNDYSGKLNMKDKEINFVQSIYKKYLENFPCSEDDVQECCTKLFIYQTIRNFRNINKILIKRK